MRALTAAVLCITLAWAPLAARADIISEPGDPARPEKIVGIAVADTGVALLVGGIIMLAFGGAADPQNDVELRRDLFLAGGICTAVGGSMAIVGFLYWMLARQRTAEWIKNGRPAAPAGKVSFAPGPNGFRLTF